MTPLLSVVLIDLDHLRTLVLYSDDQDEVVVLRIVRSRVSEARLLVPFSTSREHIERFRLNAQG